MSTLPTARSDIPMIPVPVFPHTTTFMPHGGENPHLNKVPLQTGRPMHAAQTAVATVTPQEAVQIITNDGVSKTGSEQTAGDSAEGVDPSRLKFWNTEETIELIQQYKKYLPEFHKFGQRKMNVWQRVTEEMVAKGYSNFSWAECAAKFRSLRESYRRSTPTGNRANSWQYYSLMKEVMKMEKMILEQEPATRAQKGTITCENEVHTPTLTFANVSVSNTGMSNTAVPSVTLSNTVVPIPQHPPSSHTEDPEREGTELDTEELGHKRVSLDTSGPASKKSKDSDQETEIVVGKNFNGEAVKAKTKKTASPMGVIGSLQALGKSLGLPQSQLVVSDDGHIIQTTSTPTGLFINDSGQLSHSQPAAGRQSITMPQWFKMYEKRTRAENSRRLEELKEMHRESLDLQRQTLEVARQKNDLLKHLMDSLAEFKALLQR